MLFFDFALDLALQQAVFSVELLPPRVFPRVLLLDQASLAVDDLPQVLLLLFEKRKLRVLGDLLLEQRSLDPVCFLLVVACVFARVFDLQSKEVVGAIFGRESLELL